MRYTSIKTFEQACKTNGVKPADVLPYKPSKNLTPDQVSQNGYAKLIQIARAINGKWKPDFDNSNQWKYYPWMRKNSDGFSFYVYVSYFTYSLVGSRLCFENRKKCEYAAKTFRKEYNEYML